jgi:hypothetical protein
MTTRSFPVTGPIQLVVRSGHGSVHVDARDDISVATVTLTAQGDAAVLERAVEMRGSTLAVVLPRQGGIFDLPLLGRHRNLDAVDIEVCVPTGSDVKISTFTAEVTLTGRMGAADIASGVAAISAQDVDGDLRLRFGSGAAEVRSVRGNVQSRAASGSAHFGEVGGAFTSACGSGDVSLEQARGAVRTRAGSGGAVIGAAHGDVDFVSGSGSVTVGLPAGRSARLDLTTGSGRVESELPVESKATAPGRPLSVRIRTGSGDIRLVRAAA